MSVPAPCGEFEWMKPSRHTQLSSRCCSDASILFRCHANPNTLWPQVVLISQSDVTLRIELERKLSDLMDSQLTMLEGMFPRHVLEHLATGEVRVEGLILSMS